LKNIRRGEDREDKMRLKQNHREMLKIGRKDINSSTKLHSLLQYEI